MDNGQFPITPLCVMERIVLPIQNLTFKIRKNLHEKDNTVVTVGKRPEWLKVKLSSSPKFVEVSGLLIEQKLNTVCRSAHCPNIGECWGRGTATFMILGNSCTRNCKFCAIGHGSPEPVDADEPYRLAQAAAEMGLKWVVVTSVTRDDLPDGGAGHFAATVRALREAIPDVGVEILVPDFYGHEQIAVELLTTDPPDIMNHNIETVPRLYPLFRPSARYAGSLLLIAAFSAAGMITKAGMFVGVGETIAEVEAVLRDMRLAGVQSLTVGQYLRPSLDQLPVERYVHPDEFKALSEYAKGIGFLHVASGPLVRSSYHAEEAGDFYELVKQRRQKKGDSK